MGYVSVWVDPVDVIDELSDAEIASELARRRRRLSGIPEAEDLPKDPLLELMDLLAEGRTAAARSLLETILWPERAELRQARYERAKMARDPATGRPVAQ